MKSLISKILLLVVFALGATIQNVFAQPECPPDYPGCEWISTSIPLSDPKTGCRFVVNHEYRCCNGAIEVRYNGITRQGNCDWMRDFSIYHHNISSWMELVDLLMLQTDFYAHCPQINSTIPDCPEQGLPLYGKFYSASCGVWLKCTYEVAPESAVSCENPADMPGSAYMEGGVLKVDIWKWTPCGKACCQRTYTVCKGANPAGGSPMITITNSERIKIGECDAEPITPMPRPCQDDCQ